jgi:hypothetical protein
MENLQPYPQKFQTSPTPAHDFLCIVVRISRFTHSRNPFAPALVQPVISATLVGTVLPVPARLAGLQICVAVRVEVLVFLPRHATSAALS